MKLQDYGRCQKKRNLFVKQSDLLLVGIDISKAKHDACFDRTNHCLTFGNHREGYQKFEATVRTTMELTGCSRSLIAMEPSGLYWQGLYNRLRQCGFNVCLVNCLAVRNNRRTMHDGLSKTDKKDAQSILDLVRQGKFFLPVVREPELEAAYRLMRRHMACKKRVSQLRNQLRGIVHLSFPEFNELVPDITQPTALRFLISNPTPTFITMSGRKRFLEKWRPRRKAGQWNRAKLERIYELAKKSVGLKDPFRVDAMEIRALAEELKACIAQEKQWAQEAYGMLKHREDLQLLLTLPRIGKTAATAILCYIGNIDSYSNGKQLVKLAGLDIRHCESGSSIRKHPHISHVGSAFLRHIVFYYSLRLIGYVPEFKALHQRYKQNAPGKGAGKRGLMVVCDKVLRIIYAMLKKKKRYHREHDKMIACHYEKLSKVA